MNFNSINPFKGSSPIEDKKSVKTSKSQSTKSSELAIISPEKQLSKPEKPKGSKTLSLFSTKKKSKELVSALPKASTSKGSEQDVALNRAMEAIKELSKVNLGEGVKYNTSAIMNCYVKHPETREKIEIKLSQTFASSENPEVSLEKIWKDMRGASFGRGLDGLARNQGFFLLCNKCGLDINFTLRGNQNSSALSTGNEAVAKFKKEINMRFDEATVKEFKEKTGLGGSIEEESEEGVRSNSTPEAKTNASSKALTGELRKAYGVLGIKEDASLDDVKAAWKTLVLSLHPDIVGGESRSIGEINEAYNMVKGHLA